MAGEDGTRELHIPNGASSSSTDHKLASKGPRRGALKDLKFYRPSLLAQSPCDQANTETNDAYTRIPPASTALSDITEATSHLTCDATRGITTPDLGLSAPVVRVEEEMENHTLKTSESDDHSECGSSLPTSSGTATATPLDDSCIPLAASSGKVGTLLVRIDRGHSRAFLYGNLIIIGALSHQTWVSGEVLCFDVEIDNTSEKFVKKIELQFIRAISANIVSNDLNGGIRQVVERTDKTLATWIWKKGADGWAGVAPQTQMTRTWNPIVPAGQATTSERGVEASYYLAISVPSLIGKATCTSIPLKIIHPNSLGKFRLEQRLRHAFAKPAVTELGNSLQSNISVDPPLHLSRRASRRQKDDDDYVLVNEQQSRGSKETSRSSIDKRNALPSYSWDVKKDIESNPRSIFLNTNPIPHASDELLSELLPRLESTSSCRKSRKSPRKHNLARHKQQKMADRSLLTGGTASTLSRGGSSSMLKPLSAIGAHCRRKSSDDIRAKAQNGLLNPPMKPVARASFDDYIRFRPDPLDIRAGNSRGEVPTRSENQWYPNAPSSQPAVPGLEQEDVRELNHLSGRAKDDRGPDATSISGNESRNANGSDMAEMERFICERNDFHAARRNSSNPFFKGASGKERLCSVRYSSLKQRRLLEERRSQAKQNAYRQRINDMAEHSRRDTTEAECPGAYFRRRSRAAADRSSRYAHPASLKYTGQRTLF